MNKQDLVSVIITSKNEEDVLSNLLKSIINQTYKKVEIVQVDNNSIDATVEIAKKFDIIPYIFGPERSAQRNFGAKKAKGRFLFFLDADMELAPDVISQCIENIENGEKIAGVVIPEKSIGSTFWEKIKAFERSFYNEKGDTITDAARFFRKDIFDKVGGYDETITGPEDWELPETIKGKGFSFVRITSPIYHHERITSIWLLAKKKYYYALKADRYLKRHKIPPISPKTIYFLRPVFYKNWQKLITHPVLSIGLILMFSIELLAGGLGYLVGRIKS